MINVAHIISIEEHLDNIRGRYGVLFTLTGGEKRVFYYVNLDDIEDCDEDLKMELESIKQQLLDGSLGTEAEEIAPEKPTEQSPVFKTKVEMPVVLDSESIGICRLLCPCCDNIYVHLEAAKIVSGYADYAVHNKTKGGAVVIKGYCENGCTFNIFLGQHEGNTFVFAQEADRAPVS